MSLTTITKCCPRGFTFVRRRPDSDESAVLAVKSQEESVKTMACWNSPSPGEEARKVNLYVHYPHWLFTRCQRSCLASESNAANSAFLQSDATGLYVKLQDEM